MGSSELFLSPEFFMVYWRLWFVIAVRYLLKDKNYYATKEDYELFIHECELLRGMFPIPRTWFQKWLTKRVLTELDLHIEKANKAIRMGLVETLVLTDDRV